MGIVQRQGVYNTIITYTGIILGFVNLLIVQPHFLSKEEIGLTRILFSFSALAATFMPLGMNSVILKYFPSFRNHEKGHSGFFGLSLLVAFIGFVTIGGLIFIFKSNVQSFYVDQSKLFSDFFYFVFPFTFFLSLINIFNSYCYSLFKTSFPSLLNDVITRIFSMALFAVYYNKLINLQTMIFLFTSIYGLQFLFLLIYIFKIDNPKFKIAHHDFREMGVTPMVKYGLMLSITAISSLGLKYLDTVLLGHFVPLALVGVYAISAFIPAVIEAPLGAFEKIGLASISDAWVTGKLENIKLIYFQSAKYLLFLGGLLFLGINLNSKELFDLIPAKDFHAGIPVVFFISLGALCNMATGINDSIIYTSDKYHYATYFLIIILVFDFIANIVLIPIYGITGAAIATAASAFLFNLMKFFFIWKHFGLQPFTISTLHNALVILSLYILFYFLPIDFKMEIGIIAKSICIAALYFAATVMLKVISMHEIKNFLKQKGVLK